jgi:hypothetical protein
MESGFFLKVFAWVFRVMSSAGRMCNLCKGGELTREPNRDGPN